MENRKYLVTAANGKLGRKVVSYLLNDFGISPSQLIVTARDAKNSDLGKLGLEVREADYADPVSLDKAFIGVNSLLLVSADKIGERDKLHANVIYAAERAGIEFITYTSMPSPEQSPIVFAFEHHASEHCIAESKIPNWTILRNNWYFENLHEFYAGVLTTQHWLTATAEGRQAQISRLDLAYAAAAALYQSSAGKKSITLNGPTSLSINEMAEAINEVLGLKVNVTQVSDDRLKGELGKLGLPEEVIGMMVSMEQHNRENLSYGSSDEFKSLTGRDPMSFKDWLIENKTYLLNVSAS